jgi:hypothetical protein
MIILLIAFLLLLAWVALANGSVSVSIPAESLALVERLGKDLESTAIPAYVLQYGISPPSKLDLFEINGRCSSVGVPG